MRLRGPVEPLHIVVKFNPEEIETLSDDAIIERWTSLFKGPLLVQKWQKGKSLTPAEAQAASDSIAVYRKLFPRHYEDVHFYRKLKD